MNILNRRFKYNPNDLEQSLHGFFRDEQTWIRSTGRKYFALWPLLGLFTWCPMFIFKSNELQWLNVSQGTMASGLHALSRLTLPACEITTMTSANTMLTSLSPKRHMTHITQCTFHMGTMIVFYVLEGQRGGYPAVLFAGGGSIPWQW